MCLLTALLAFLVLVVSIAIGVLGLAWQPYILWAASRPQPGAQTDKGPVAVAWVIIGLFNLTLVILGAFPGYYVGCLDLMVSPVLVLFGAEP